MIHERIGWFIDSKTHEGVGRPGSICEYTDVTKPGFR